MKPPPRLVVSNLAGPGTSKESLTLKKIAVFAIAVLTATAALAAAPKYGKWGVDVAGMDTSVKPGDDFFRYANGKWAATTQIPGDKSSYGSFDVLEDLSEAQVHGMLDELAAAKDLKPGSDEAKIATIYRTFLDEATVEKLDNKPLIPYIDAVKKAGTREDIARIMGRSVGAFGTSLYATFVTDDQKDPDRYALYLYQSGLGLPDREYYLRDNFKEQKARYQKYVADMLRLAGWNDPEKNAADVVAFETKLAEAHWTRAESRDRDKNYNPTTLADLEKNDPGFPWAVAFKAAGIENAGKVVVFQNTAFPKLAAIFGSTPV
ncbi:MAG TPA: M13 family metallopeptidase N-terminal domain-containing protein, partial [Thermoanaerobaculia bacterium]|nr:M13 family metallopeptidase N-terminal domain-containing protein [Thermoanaerobaculia bacterium]